MRFIFRLAMWVGGICLLGSLLLQGLWHLARRRREGARPWSWKRFFLGQLVLIPVLVFFGLPVLFGYFGTRAQTRGDERAYPGPRFDSEGRWILMNRDRLKTTPPPDAAERARIQKRSLRLTAPDGVELQVYHVPAAEAPARAQVLLVHGLFRSAMELEPVADMFRRAGCDCWLLEMGSHGKSSRRSFTYGAKEQGDVLTAARHIRSARPDSPLIIWGISLGGAAASLAVPEIEGLAGLVIDCPTPDLRSAANNYLGSPRRGPDLPQVWIDMISFWLQSFAGFDMDVLRPAEVYRALDPQLPVLFLGGELDHAMPADSVRALYASLPQDPANKQLWIAPGAQHGKGFEDRPREYEAQLRAFLDRALD